MPGMRRDHGHGESGLRAVAVRSWRLRVLLLPQDEISIDTWATPPERAVRDRPPRQAEHRVGDRLSGDRCPWTRAWSPLAYLENPLEYVSAHSSNPREFVGRILTGLARSVKALEPGVGKHLVADRAPQPRQRSNRTPGGTTNTDCQALESPSLSSLSSVHC
jgi:hypothetical protein